MDELFVKSLEGENFFFWCVVWCFSPVYFTLGFLRLDIVVFPNFISFLFLFCFIFIFISLA